MKHVRRIIVLVLLAMVTVVLLSPQTQESRTDLQQWTDQHDFPVIPSVSPDQAFISYTAFRETIANANATAFSVTAAMAGRQVRFDTALELHRFSLDVSAYDDLFYETGDPLVDQKLDPSVVEVLLSLDYVLGSDIDYSVMRSRAFIPIGYDYISIDGTPNTNVFTGTFDGRGFEIRNLLLAGYDQVVIVEGEDEEEVDIATAPYYAMFPINNGTIQNVGLVDPTLEVKFEVADFSKTANLVGLNNGTIDHVYVIETRGNDEGGIRMKAPIGFGTDVYEAAGIVYQNNGAFTNAYYVGESVVNTSYITSFESQPVLFDNDGTASNLVYDSDVYALSVTVGSVTFNVEAPSAIHTPETTQTLKSSSSSGNWYYYPLDRYPTLLGLDYDQGRFQIENAVDMVTFRMIQSYSTVLYGTPFRESAYHVTEDIDMSHVSPDAYQTPDVTFLGTFSGDDPVTPVLVKNFTPEPVITTEGYYTGLFSVLEGTVSDLMFAGALITVTDLSSFVQLPAYIGGIAGRLDGGIITNVLIDNQLTLDSSAIGVLYMGGIAGMASGTIEKVYSQGLIDAGSAHLYDGTIPSSTSIHVGGIIGTHGEGLLDLYDAKNTADITGFGTADDLTTIAPLNVYTGGVIARITNSSDTVHRMGLLTNTGTITINDVVSATGITQNVGGVIGFYEGVPFTLDTRFGLFTNDGDIDITGKDNDTVIASNVVTSDFDAPAEFIFLFNTGDFIASDMTGVTHTMLLLNLGEGMTLSQSGNSGNITLPVAVDYSGVYLSPTNEPSFLRFVENSGNITLSQTTVSSPLDLAGITLSDNVEFLNIVASGDITLSGIDATAVIHVAGITKELLPGRSIKNTLTQGTITVADIDTTSNLYIGGFVNYNRSGNLDPSGEETRPKATYGILNSINDKSILSYVSSSVKDITGLGNTFAGGIATFNDGSIQDSANTGDIRLRNTSAINPSQVTFETEDTLGGRVIQYRHGVITGGVAASVLSSVSRIYDTTNSGEIIALSRNYARAGGILAVALYVELTAGNVSAPQNDTIFFSIVSNGINYGNVSAISEDIHIYDTDPFSFSHGIIINGASRTNEWNMTSVTTTVGTEERPGVHASAGGVIGYGLSTMRRMINHGEVSSSDVAGGIVGATFVDTTIDVNIDTAINYGSVRAFDRTFFDAIDDDMDYDSITENFYDVNDPFIYPVTFNDIRRYPESKRGIGGIFGRLQRARNQRMRSTNGVFDFIANMNPDVDLIGRLDQVYNWSSSALYFVFDDAIYYSAKKNDTTQAVFTGFTYYFSSTNANRPTVSESTITTQTFERFFYSTETRYRRYLFGFIPWDPYTFTVRQPQRFETISGQTSISGPMYTQIGGVVSGPVQNTTVIDFEDGTTQWINFGAEQDVGEGNLIPTPNPTVPVPISVPPVVVDDNETLSRNTYYFGDLLDVPVITEDPNDPIGQFVYDPDFEMRDDDTITSTGDPITQYIYYIENAILADRFETERPFGMYVLSTSSGSNFGAVIPASLDLTRLYPLSGLLDFDTDYVNTTDRVPVDTLVIEKYAGLQQTKYNDRSKLLELDQDVRLAEDGGSETFLSDADIDFDARTITFDLHLDTIIDMSPAPTTVSYGVTDAVLPFSAIIAVPYQDYLAANPGVTLDQFRQILLSELGNVASTTLAPDLSADLSAFLSIGSPTTVSLGTFRSYSEVAANLTSFINPTYYTDYDVFLRLIPKSVAPNSPLPDDYVVDGGAAVAFSHATVSVAEQVDDSLRLTFDDPGNILPEGYDMSRFVSLWYDGAEVDPADYTLISELRDSSGNMGFSIALDPLMRGGTYEVRWKYYLAAQERSILFTHRASTENSILDLDYPTYGDTTIAGTTFETFIDFNFELAFDTLSFSTITDPLTDPWYDNTRYSVSILDLFEISPYATLENVTYLGMGVTNGYRTHTVTYDIRSESGVLQTYTHQFTERPLSIVDVFKNQVKDNIDDLFATREATSTVFSADFAVNELLAEDVYNLFSDDMTSYFTISVTGVDPLGAPLTPEDITYSADRYLNIIMGRMTMPGTYTFTFTYTRSSGTSVITDDLVITKLEGASAYLSDIRFSLSATETDYPDMFVSDSVGTVITSPFLTDVYINGIDYDDSEFIVFNYRIDGEVANTPLDNYTPFFLDYLPLGATIARKIYPLEDPLNDWTVEVDNAASAADKAMLAADFTLLPDTGNEPGEDEDVIITYRVTSEDGNTVVFYHITVVDILYNVSIIFEVLYDDPVLGIVDAKDSELLEVPILINVKNFNTDVPVTNIVYPTVAQFPTFTSITSVNNSVFMFYVANEQAYSYRFGRNLSGFFAFTVDLPKDPDGNDYTYTIRFNGDDLDEVSDFAPGLEGYYFYINGGTKNRTRRFSVIISRTGTSSDDGWGLDDNTTTWKD